MKKLSKLFALLFTLIFVVTAFAGCSEQKTDTKLKYEIVNNQVKITGYTDTTTRDEIEVPDEIDGYPVTEISDFSLFNAESLKIIKIGKNVKTIGNWSMTNNQSLKEFVVDTQNQYFTCVDGVLFSKDMKVLLYYPPAKNIKFNKYGESQNTTQYKIPEGVETIRSKAFYKCYYVDKITIPNSVKRIEEKAFHRTSALNTLVLSNNLEYIGKDAFAYCDKIEKVTIPKSVKQIDEYAFFNCSAIKEVNMFCKESCTKLGKNWYPTYNGKQIKDCNILWN